MLRPRFLLLWALLALAVGAFARWVTGTPDAALPPLEPAHLKKLARETPADDANAQVRLASELLREAERSGDSRLPPRAVLAARRALELDAGRIDAARLVLRALQEGQRYEELFIAARDFASRHPTEAFFIGATGDAALELGRYDAADAAYQRLQRLDSSLATAARLGHLRRVKGDARGALEFLKAAVRTQQPGEAAVTDALCELGDAYLALDEADLAQDAFSVALTRNPRSARAHLGRGHALRMRGENTDAISAYQAALNLRPRPATRALLADALAAAGWTAEAGAHYERALADSRESDARTHALLLLDLGRELPRAEALAREVYAHRQDIHSEGLLAYALFRNGKVEEAYLAVSRALRLGTRDARLSYVAGLITSARGEPGTARRFLSEALHGAPPLPPEQQARAKALLGEAAEASLAAREQAPSR